MGNQNRTVYIAICDDEKHIGTDLEDKLDSIAKELHINIDISMWFSGETLSKYLEKENPVDLLFLGVRLPGKNGIDVGNYIRHTMNNHTMQIVYISSDTDYDLSLFRIHPFQFLIKPVQKDQLHEVMVDFLRIFQTQNEIFEYQSGKDHYCVPYREILYFRSELRKVVIVMCDREVSFYGKLSELRNVVPTHFLEIHKSYIVNTNFVRRYSFDSVEMQNQDILSISKPYQKNVRTFFEERGVR